MEYTNIMAEDIISELNIKAQPVTIKDLAFTLDWIGAYEPKGGAVDNEILQSIANTQKFLKKEIETRIMKQMKKDYAKEHGVKVSQVRIVKKSA